ncbi:MAG TPA: mannose-1-phosphate guanylyltransferase/mannose-6-phosphate isomerase [Casimicrobiaceae bacterium]|nr:mannose-1-phosphate guanylyltransferase/mannose-6-phosphate isomerase [Casimicrobiaceae bacterium]
MHPVSVVPIVLSGGSGTRLWPLSREAAPKPFMPLPDGDTLLAKTARRALALPGVTRLVTVTNRDYFFHTRDVYAGLGDVLGVPADYLLEPFGRNTAPAVAIAALFAAARGPRDSVLLVLPADHLINEQRAFASAVSRAVALARDGALVTFGIAPTHPETGFGYIECGDALPDAPQAPTALRVQRFVEKPTLAKAREYLTAGHFLWNSGMFAFTPDAIVRAFARHAPAVLEAVKPIADALAAGDAAMREIDAALFAAVPDISIDYAVMERAAAAGDVTVVRGSFDWSDVGSWQAVAELTQADGEGNRGRGERVAIDTRHTYVHAEDRIVATVGVENLVIVDTPDAVLVAHRDHLQRVKEVVGELKARGHEAYKLHKTVSRPWGTYTVLEEGRGFKIKRIEVRPGAALSLQLHHRRSEHWVVVQGTARVTCGDDVFDIGANQSTFIPVETRHRLENPGTEPLAIIEVQCGDYLGEDDIVRFDDRYGREKAKAITS